jgi:hypothetical protein
VQDRKIELARGAWGIVGVMAPQLLLQRTGGDPHDRVSVVVMRVLGVRQAAQAVLSGVSPTAPVLAMGVWVDSAHALSGVALAVARRRYAKPALADAAIAAGWAAAGLRDLRTNTQSNSEELRSRLARNALSIVPGGRYLLAQA